MLARCSPSLRRKNQMHEEPHPGTHSLLFDLETLINIQNLKNLCAKLI